MTDQIVSRDYMRTKGAEAFADGQGRNDHDMNPGSAAIAEWQAGWDQVYAAAAAALARATQEEDATA